MKRLLTLTTLVLCLAFTAGLFAAPADSSSPEDVEAIKAKIKDLNKRLKKVEKKSVLDKLNFSGDYRFEVNSIDGTIPDHYDGMALQNLMIGAMFYYGATQQFPMGTADIHGFIAENYANWLYFTNSLTFQDLAGMMAMFPPEMQQQLMMMLLPDAYREGYDYANDILYTNRLRLNFKADVMDDVSFSGRLSMYKAWGDSTGVQVFNGQPTSMNIDGTTSQVPNSDIVRVDRAYFTWKNMFDSPLYLSIGRRPSTGGPPMHLREGELRGGTPMGLAVEYQFDGITLGYSFNEKSTFRLCYGVGFESGFGQAAELQSPADRLDDVHMGGINWDLYKTDNMLVQTTMMRAFDVTDGFGGLVVMPSNPLTGESIGAPLVMRYSPSANLGDIDLAGILLLRRDGPIDWFVNYGYMKSHPDAVTTPFGGLFSDPFETPESQTGSALYAGLRFNFNEDRCMLGLEYNHGSEYWFNFAQGADDIISPKLSTRGEAYELYFLHKVHKNVMLKFDYILYDYDYSGSGWHVGGPKEMDSTPILGFPTYDEVGVASFSLVTKF